MLERLDAPVRAVRDENSLYQRIAELEGENRRLQTAVRDRSQADNALRERVKELNCLCEIMQLVEEHGSSTRQLLQGIANLIPRSWQYPEVCCARLLLAGEEFTTNNFRESPWKQSAEIRMNGRVAGAVEVYYLSNKPMLDEGPFSREERTLINTLAEHVGKLLQRTESERHLHESVKQLQVEQTALKEANTALHGVLARTEEAKRATQTSIMANVDKILMPVLHALETEIPPQQMRYVTLLKQNLEQITSPFADKLSKAFMKLTAVEIRICDMIRNGMSSKEIAQVRTVSPATVARQRERIREKLGIVRSDINLATYLRTFLPERARDLSADPAPTAWATRTEHMPLG